jgi:hypothetical protein
VLALVKTRNQLIGTDAAGSLQALHTPIPCGVSKLKEVRRLQMGLERCLRMVKKLEHGFVAVVTVVLHR